MLRIWCIFFSWGWLAASGAILKIDLGTVEHGVCANHVLSGGNIPAVSSAMTESNILQKLVAAADVRLKVISQLKVKDLQPPEITLTFLPGTGLFTAVLSHITILGKRMMPQIENKIQSVTLHDVLPDVLCPAVDAVLTLVNQKFATLISPSSVGAARSIQYTLLSLPVTRKDFLELDLNTTVLQEGRHLIDLPADPPALTALPPKMDSATQLALSVNFLSAELTLIQTSFNLDVIDSTFSESLPPSQPMVIEIRITKPPVLTMQQDKGLVRLFSSVEFLTSQPGAARESLFVLNTHINLDTKFSIREEKLRISLALDSLYEMALAASSIGMFAELLVKGFLVNIIEAVYVPAINGALQEGIPLPNLLGIKYENADISMAENALVLNVKAT